MSHRAHLALRGWAVVAVLSAALDGAEPVVVEVDCDTVIARGEEPLKYGVCLNYLIDSDVYDAERARTIRQSLEALGVKAIRWNEGEIGDKMIWSIPPFKAPDVRATHLRTPGTVHYNWRVDAHGKMQRPMELDEAIGIARDLRLELFIIVGIDAIWVEEPSVRARDTAGRTDEPGKIHKRMDDFDWAEPGKSAREMIEAGTAALAEYLGREAADVEVFVEIGNENYLGDASWKPECYAALVNVLGAKIKGANPRVRVGAQLAHQFPWTSVSEDGRPWNDVMREALELGRIDHFVAHQYGYRETLNLDSAVAVLESLDEADRRRIEITVTELGTWHLPGSKDRWSPNDLRRSLYQFRWLGMIQRNGKGRIRTPLFWTSRWLDALKRGAYEKSFHALNLAGELTPSGMAIRIWNEAVHDSLVRTTVSEGVKDLDCFASRELSDPRQLTVWLVNNDEDERKVSLKLEDYRGNRAWDASRYEGEGPEDTRPTLRKLRAETFRLTAGPVPAVDLTMPAYSMTVLRLK